MKQILCIVCMLALFLYAYSVIEQTPEVPEGNYTYGIYQITFKTKKISNNCVGNDWSFTYTYDGKPIKNGQTITYSLEFFYFPANRSGGLGEQ